MNDARDVGFRPKTPEDWAAVTDPLNVADALDELASSGSIYFEAYLRATKGTVYADLYDETGSASVPGSQVSTNSPSFVLVRSSVLTLDLNSTYRPRLGQSGTDVGQCLSAVALAI